MAEMKQIKFPGSDEIFEIVDAKARQDIASHATQISSIGTTASNAAREAAAAATKAAAAKTASEGAVTSNNNIKTEITGAYTLDSTHVYDNLGDALRGAVALAAENAERMLGEYESFTIEIVDALPDTGVPNTFYLVSNASGTAYRKYWWITDDNGNSRWDEFGGASTLVVSALPGTGNEDVDYILVTNDGCLSYKYIDGEWELVGGSLVYVGSVLPDSGNDHTDYFVLSASGLYVHYRWIGGKFCPIGGDNYTKTEVDNMLRTLSDAQTALGNSIEGNRTSIDANTANIAALGQSVEGLQQQLLELDTEGYTYHATYGKAMLATGEEADNVFTLYETKEGVETIKSQFVIQGGGGGTTATTNLIVERVTPSPLVITPTDKAVIAFNYSSTDDDGETVDGTYTWKLGNNIIASGTLTQGENSFDLTEYCSVGTQKLMLTVVDAGGSIAVRSWTVQIVDVRITSNFSDRITYPTGSNVSFSYTPYGAINKTVHFKLDGKILASVTTSASGIVQSYDLTPQTHGAHLLECWITATVNNTAIETEHIFRDIIWYDASSDVPVIGCIYRYDHYGKVAAKQYNTTSIPLYVYDPNTASPTITKTVDGETISTETLTAVSNVWAYKTDEIGDHTLTVSCGETTVTIVMAIEELGIDVSPVTANLAFDFNPTDLTNSSANRLWTDPDTGVAMSVSDNFDWTNGGYQIDAEGNKYFCIKAGTTATIGYQPFADQNMAVRGSEFKAIFRVTNVKQVEGVFLQCLKDGDSVGLEMRVHAAYLTTSTEQLYIPYCEEDVVEFEYNIHSLDTENTEATSIIMSYEDGVPLRPMIYDATHRLHQYEPQNIVIGSEDCDVHIYRMKAYSAELTDSDILSNFIADARNSDEMIARYNRNQIYDENNNLTPESVAKACPQLKIIKIECPHFTNDKKDYVKNTNIQCIHVGGDPILDNWTARNAYHSGQGTTSNEYGYAGRNIDIIMCADGKNAINDKIPLDESYITEITLGDGTKYSDGTGKVTLSRNSVPNNWFNIKVNIASSENANNSMLARRYNTYLPYTGPATRRDPNVKNTMEFANCVIFVRESDEDISTHREFTDTQWHFYAMGNIGDSKNTDHTRVTNAKDPKEFVIEIADNTLPNSLFDTGVTDESGKMVYPITEAQWAAGNEKYDSLHNSFGDTFEFRYEMKGITAEQQAANIQTFCDFYKWMITVPDADFASELGDWFIVDSALYQYLFTERYTMIDNRAKNTFWHWSKWYITEAEAVTLGDSAAHYIIDDAAAAINGGYRLDQWGYDFDTGLGINNSGELRMTYGKEDIDYRTDGVPASGFIFNAADSVFWRRIRALMHSELCVMYQALDSSGCWSDSGLINQFDAWQEQFPEELWRIDIERKYYRTYEGGGLNGGMTPEPTDRFLRSMLNGRKKYQRRQFERDQAVYMGTKYLSTTVKADQIMFRCNTPVEAAVAPDYTLKIVPYSDMYISVLFGNMSTVPQVRAKAGVEYTINCPLTEMDNTAILIYAASRIQALNDISACYIEDNDFSKASKLKKLVIGNSTEGYSNQFMSMINLGNNALLEELDLRNCAMLVGSLNLSSCGNLEKLYAQGTAITGVLFASNGMIAHAHLPDTVNSLVMRHLAYLTDLQVSYDVLESLTEEYSVVDELAIVQDAVDTLQTLNLAGINWLLPDTTLLNAILAMNSSTLSGTVEISGAIRQMELQRYAAAWPDLEVIYDPSNIVTQYLATYANADGTVLYTAYVDRGSLPPDPVAEGIIATPTLESTEQYDFTYASWDDITSAMLAPRTITAVYTEHIRSYNVRWYAMPGGNPLASVVAEYGADVVYPNETPVREDEESMYVYNLFSGWDKSTGFITEDVNVYAIWDRAELPPVGKDMSDMTPVEIYAVTKTGKAADYFVTKDHVDISIGHDFNFSNVESQLLAENLVLDGASVVDTGIQLFGKNARSFTLAISYQFDESPAQDATLLSCFRYDGTEGFRLRYNSNPGIQWGDKSAAVGYRNKKEMLVLRWKKEDPLRLYIYNYNTVSSVFSDDIFTAELLRSRETVTDATLIIGAHRFGDGVLDGFASGKIHWCKIWFGDLGTENSRQLAAWPHETWRADYANTGCYYLAPEGTSQKSNASFILNHLVADRTRRMNPTATNVGSWESSELRTWMHEKLISALPVTWRTMLKQVKIKSTAGEQSTTIVITKDYLYLAARNELHPYTDEPYASEGSHIYSWYTADRHRVKFFGIPIPDGAQYFSNDIDPRDITSNNVSEGDIWLKTTESNRGYILHDGEWHAAYNWWTRSPTDHDSLNFAFVNNYGYINYYFGASNTYGICPCFSI